MVGRSLREAPPKLLIASKADLTWRVWGAFLRIVVETRRRPLPEMVADLVAHPRSAALHIDPKRLGRIVAKVLRVGPWRARCLFTSLVLFRLLREQGDHPVLVIGLPAQAAGTKAHAWVEIAGLEVGPPPGSRGHVALARFGDAPGSPGSEA